MSRDLESLALVIHQLAATMPSESVSQLASELSALRSSDWANAQSYIAANISNTGLRRRVEDLLDTLQKCEPQIDGPAAALALLTAFQASQLHRAEESLDLVWTGPDSRIIPMRRTDQALLQVIHSATSHLLVVSFAVYKVSAVVQALAQAAQRGVAISICIESPDASEGKIAYDAVRAFGNEVSQHARFYVWPLDKRPKSSNGKHGSLHSKLAVADGKILLVSSANLTEYAMNLNMELGVLIQGGELPVRVERHFGQLMEQGTFEMLELR